MTKLSLASVALLGVSMSCYAESGAPGGTVLDKIQSNTSSTESNIQQVATLEKSAYERLIGPSTPSNLFMYVANNNAKFAKMISVTKMFFPWSLSTVSRYACSMGEAKYAPICYANKKDESQLEKLYSKYNVQNLLSWGNSVTAGDDAFNYIQSVMASPNKQATLASNLPAISAIYDALTYVAATSGKFTNDTNLSKNGVKNPLKMLRLGVEVPMSGWYAKSLSKASLLEVARLNNQLLARTNALSYGKYRVNDRLLTINSNLLAQQLRTNKLLEKNNALLRHANSLSGQILDAIKANAKAKEKRR